MTDETTAADRAERIRRLQERRAATSNRTVAATTSGPIAAADGTRPGATRTTKPRRRHPAMATRILLAGLSVASFFGIAGSVALANAGTPTTAPTPVAASPAVAQPAAAGSATPAQVSNTATAAKAGAANASAPHVKTRGS